MEDFEVFNTIEGSLERPPDMGKIDMSDDADDLPNAPTTYFEELEVPTIADVSSPKVEIKNAKVESKTESDQGSSPIKLAIAESMLKPGQTTMGFVKNKVEKDPVEMNADDVPSGEDTPELTPQIYNVTLANNKTVEVEQVQIDENETIPYGTTTPVLFDPISKKLVMQVPVWLDPTEEFNA